MTQTHPPETQVDSAQSHAPIVIITGASSGIGRSTAVAFARRGWRVGLIARGQAGLEAARSEVLQASSIGSDASVATALADVSDYGALEAAAARIEATLGIADAWINCAGTGTFGRFLDTPIEEFKRVTDVTYMGAVNGTRVALTRMLPRDQGRIVNVCSAVAFHGMPLLTSYSGAKNALRGFDQALRAELAQDGSRVRLTSVFPPAVNTPFFDHAPSHMGALGRPMSPVYQPHVIAEAIFLAATTRKPEVLISFTTVLFAAAVRVMPGVVSRAIRRLGYEGQLTDDQAAKARHESTLFKASDAASPSRGGFDAISRSSSVQVTLMRWLSRWRASAQQTNASNAQAAPPISPRPLRASASGKSPTATAPAPAAAVKSSAARASLKAIVEDASPRI